VWAHPNIEQFGNAGAVQTWFACNRLLDSVHVLPRAASGARVARMSRLGRRQ